VNHAREVTPLGKLLECKPAIPPARPNGKVEDATQDDFHTGMAPVHPIWRLPSELTYLPTGHYGSHLFLVDDFVRACVTGALPPNHVWAAARYNIPGIVAHESAKRDGERLKVPDLGDAPAGVTLLNDQLDQLAPTIPAWTLPKPAHVGKAWW
jgi:hypothetical protein